MQPPAARVESSGTSPLAACGGYRFSVGHLLLWITTTAAVLAFLQAYNPYPNLDRDSPFAAYESEYRRQWLIHRLLAPAYGAALAGGLITITQMVRDRELGQRQPGHWLLVTLASWTGALALLVAGAGSIAHLSEPLTYTLFSMPPAFALLPSAAAASRLRNDETDVWKAAFALQAIVAGSAACSSLLFVLLEDPFTMMIAALLLALAGVAILLAGLTTLLAIVSDISRRRPRDLLHWIGVVSLLLVAGHPVAIAVGWMAL